MATKTGRLAMRHEGNFWNAYYAMPDTMEGAVLLGSIAIRFVASDVGRKDRFMEMMKEAVTDLIFESAGARAEWPDGPQPAPQSERAGHS